MRAQVQFAAMVMSIILTAVTTHAKGFSDELVSSLACENISSDQIYRAIPIQKAFSSDRRVIISNAQMNYHVNSYGDCWSIAHWQRLNLLLGRRAQELVYKPMLISNLIRGVMELPIVGTVTNIAYSSYSVFEMPQSRQLMGIEGTLEDDFKKIGRDYWADLHIYQKGRFYRATNLFYVISPRTQNMSYRTLVQVSKLANTNRLPMIIMRFGTFDQHVVLVRNVLRTGTDKFRFNVIDESDATDDDRYLSLEKVNGNWAINYVTWSKTEPVDVFMTGEEERSKIDQALVDYYRMRCSSRR